MGRSGTETIIYTNSTPVRVYYIGVKSEDQQAADFGFYGVAQQATLQRCNADGNTITATGTSLPVFIPNCTSAQPALVFAFMFNPNPVLQKIRRVTATLGIQPPESGRSLRNAAARWNYHGAQSAIRITAWLYQYLR